MLKNIFTTQERKVINFLIITFVLGCGVKLYREYLYSKPNEKQKVYADSLRTILEEKSKSSNHNHNAGIFAKVNINTAEELELESLPGIGKKSAENIIAYRKKEGKFETIEDIQNVKGIGEKSFERIKDFITVEDSVTVTK